MTTCSHLARLQSIALVLAALASSVASTTARAEDQANAKTKSEPLQMKKDADALMDQDKYAEALALYAKAYALTHDPALLYNQGRALEALGEYPEALDKLEQFEHQAPASLQRKVAGLGEHMKDLRARITTVVISSNAPEARLLVRDKVVGAIERERTIRTRSGPATIEVTAEGYEPYRKTLELPAGGTLSLSARLVPKKRDPAASGKPKPAALIVVRTSPAADIALDGRALGRAPLEAHVLPGSYVLTAKTEGYDDERVPMTVANGDRRKLDLELHRSGSILSRWWFWTGIGVLVAGGAATFVVLTTERAHDEGTLEPGSVPAP